MSDTPDANNRNLTKDEAVQATFAYVERLIKAGLSISQIEAKLVEWGLEKNSASIVVNNLPDELKKLMASRDSLVDHLSKPLDPSLDGRAEAFNFYGKIRLNAQAIIELLKRLDILIVKGKPVAFGRKKWDNDVVDVLKKFRIASESIFGENIADSFVNIPGGCFDAWSCFVKLFLEIEKLDKYLVNFINGIESSGLNNANGILTNIEKEVLPQLIKEEDKLLREILGSGEDVEALTARAKQVDKNFWA